jgi:hypothetical protein
VLGGTRFAAKPRTPGIDPKLSFAPVDRRSEAILWGFHPRWHNRAPHLVRAAFRGQRSLGAPTETPYTMT